MTRLFCAAFLSLVPLLAVGFVRAADEKKPAPDAEAIKGAWTVTSINVEGEEQPAPEKEKTMTLTFTADTITAKKGADGKDEKADYKLDPAASPKTILVMPADGGEKGKKINGVYTLDGDKLTLAFAADKPEDPAPADTKPGKGRMVITLVKNK